MNIISNLRPGSLIVGILLLILISCNRAPDLNKLFISRSNVLLKDWNDFSVQNTYTTVKDSSILWAEKFWQLSKSFPDSIKTDTAIIKTFEILFLYGNNDSLISKFNSLSINKSVISKLLQYSSIIFRGTDEEKITLLNDLKNRSNNRKVKTSCLLQAMSFARISRMPLIVNELNDSLIQSYSYEYQMMGLSEQMSELSQWSKSYTDSLPIFQSKELNYNRFSNKDYSHRGQKLSYTVALSEFQIAIKAQYSYLGNEYFYRGGLLRAINNKAKIPIGMQQLTDVLQEYPRNKRPGKGYGCGLLLYSYSNERLQTWLLGESEIFDYNVQYISKQDLFVTINNVRLALGINLLQENRGPREIDEKDKKDVNENNNLIYDFQDANKKLCELLFPGDIAQNLKKFTYLIIVPTLNIGTVPFYALNPLGDSTQLVDILSISVAPSLTDLINPDIFGHRNAYIPWSWDKLKSKPLIVGNPDFPSDDKWFMPELPGAEVEANIIGTMLECKPLIGKEAQKDSILKYIAGASLIYFATHGITDYEDPLNKSFFAFGGRNFNESILTFKEIQSMPMKASLAILSSCQTGLGKIYESGVFGLTTGFQISGVPRIIMSLWNIDDQATKDLMVTFVSKLEKEYPVDALRLSMLEMREKYKDPKLWASFNYFGTKW